MSVSSNPTSVAPGSVPTNLPGALSGNSTDLFGFGTIPTNAPSVLPSTTNSTPIFPGANISPYYLQQIGANPIDLGGGLPNGGPMTIDQAIDWFDHLPHAELIQVESMLQAAGFYTDANGNPLKTEFELGTLDDQSRRAWVNALIQAYSEGASVTDTINNAIQSGAGANLRSTLPSAVLGGGNVYTIDLTQPGAVNEVANSIFESALGRLATPDELQKITNAVNSGAIAQGLTKERGAELSAQQQYQARVNQRNIQYQFETTPKVAYGPVPNAAPSTPAEYATSLLQYMGMPVTQSNVAFLTGWIQATGGNLTTMNPLGSQNATPGSQPTGTATPTYSSWDQSFAATAAALQSGSYTNIIAALEQGNAGNETGSKAIQSELHKWSGGAYSDITPQTNASQQVAAQQVNVAQQQAPTGAPAQSTQPAPTGPNASQVQNPEAYRAFLKSGGTPAEWQAQQAQSQSSAPQIGTAQSLSAEGGGPNNPPTTPAAAVSPGQQQTNPGDQYINPVTVYSQNPLTPEQASYDLATTGPNRFAFGENNFLKAFLAVVNMISKAGPTGG